ncbi:fibro-slime domain-containing protein [uncultured Bifidobacterium sp.]|uniref:fibro-slime domain-containing protein n=1 Tax=uncultured Bifidobacterium sp. TaxID=165187 RepID=UPI00258FBE0E|nr:fibro-slime domain-containing protein [uncultured Bifidobacterium sp.]
MRKLRSVVAALAAVACLYVPSAAAEPASTSDPVPPAVVAPTQTEDQTETPTGDEEVAGDTETPDQATDETPAETVDETPKQDADVVEEQPDGTVTLDQTLTYANDEYTVDVTVRGDAVVSDAEAPAADAVISDASGDLAMTVDVLDESQPEWQAVEDYAESKDEAGDVLDVTALDFGFTYQGQALDVSDCELNATVAPTAALVAAGAAPKAAAEAETGVEVTALNGVSEELGTVMVAQNEDETKSLDVTLDSAAPVLGLTAKSALNPHFTVQYYANLEVTDRDSGGYLEILNTDNGGNNQGGKLPTNGGNTPTTGLYLVDVGNGKREIRTHMELTELYTANEYDYFEAPSLPYVNIFRENGNYTANEVWVLKEGKDASSTNEADWEVHKGIVGATELHFTNNPNKADEPNTILIEKGTVIRLVANQTTSDYDNAATFYDYNITDDGKTTWDGTNGQHGINSGSNYTRDGAKLAFGNANTGTGLENESWNGNTLNQYNRSGGGLQGCTFGLVTGLDSEGHIVYADGVTAPNLFDDGPATGKVTHTDMSLDFNRAGDTYTLSSVKGANLDGLEYFNNPQTPGKDPYTHIWTNNFWPMDGRRSTDGLTGYYNDRGGYSGYDGNKLYPVSDDGQAHNNMFGMQYTVEFELTEDYVGPLEYYFFGDDDMWVFLDGRLVCDIGGVHSSVGAYVNLWDYIAKGDAGKHTLKFYYTERGLSGSTCYMQFTLPSVSSGTPQYQNGQLKVQKQVVGNADPDTEFSFDINIWSDDGLAQGSDYSIVRYNADGTQRIESSLLTDGRGKFKLKANEYVIIDYLQHGTHYTIKEANVPGVTVSNTIDNGKPNQSAEVTGTTPVGKNSIVLFTNTFRPKLPDTGGSGVWALSIGGLTLMTFAVVYGVRRRNQAINLSRS